METDHCSIVGKSLAGERRVDEQTFVSLAVLADRLECLKKLGKAFAGVEFSPHVEKLNRKSSVVAVS
jgi:hypothetical protein